ncbi:MAG: trehalose monomycolate/heme transporter [Mycobacterium sp.]|nr:trehalose monomycolate/heme transporter [Mycobacterium sp.]
MFAWWGRMVYRYRYIVIGVMVALCIGGGIFGLSLGKHVTQSGFYDETSQSVHASVLADEVYGRDRTSHIVGVVEAPDGKKVDDPQWAKSVKDELDKVKADHRDQISQWGGYFQDPTSPGFAQFATADKTKAFVFIPLKGDDDDTILKNYKTVEPDLQKVDGGNIKLAGLNPLAAALTGTIETDQKRMEVLALPLVAVVLFFVFGGVIAATLPVLIGGLSIVGSLGILRLIANFGPVHFFAQPVVTLIGLGIAIDYGLFIVSRFREEIADGYDTEAAVRRTVMTSGRTVVFSAVIIVASSAGLLLFPQGFLKSITYAMMASIMLAAILSITVLPAILGILGPNVDALGVRTLLRVPFFRDWKPTNWWLNFLADKTQKTKTREEVENGFWGRLVNVVMKRPVAFAAPIVIVMILLIIPLGQLALGGISEKYLPVNNTARDAQEEFDSSFPGFRTEKLTLVIEGANDTQISEIANKADQIPGFTSTWSDRTADGKLKNERPVAPDPNDPSKPREGADPNVTPCQQEGKTCVLQSGLKVRNEAATKIDQLRAIPAPEGVRISVGGTPALEQDSIHSLFDKLPLMVLILITTTTILMFLAFGSLVLPIKATVMSALTLGSTMGVLTWIFVDGHGEKLLNFTATPLMAPMVGMIIAVVYGLSTDYEVFLVSRMIEARERGMSTAESIRIGTATTGRLITAAALILVVVAGAFAFSELVMLKYLAFGLITALILDATIIRMFLVPAVMKMLGDDCWWAPRWMRRIQNRLGLGEIHLPDERKRPTVREPGDALVGAGAPVPPPPRRPHDPTHPVVEGATRPGAARPAPRQSPPAQAPSVAGTTRMPNAGQPTSAEPPTTRLSIAAKNAAKAVINNAAINNAATATHRTPPSAPQRTDHEIESWLGELRGGPGRPQTPGGPRSRDESAEPTTAIPVPRQEPRPPKKPKPTPPPPAPNADAESTEKLPRQGQPPAEDDRRRGSGVSAADLLRREGRL